MQQVVDLRRIADDRRAKDRASLVAGLRAHPAHIAPKYFYDALGCALYAAICETAEYYPTRAEAAILRTHREAIADAMGTGGTLVDLGAGDGRKAEAWMPTWRPDTYVGVDYAAEALNATLARLAAAFPHIDVRGVATDFTHGLDVAAHLPAGRATFFYPGSSIGNFAPDEALALLSALRGHAREDRPVALLIGIDTHKDVARLVAAYDDATGVTAAFNRNVLNHVNALLGTSFDPSRFRHVALYDATHRRIEMHLEAIDEQAVTLDGARRTFAAGERIHTENSWKYAPDDFARLLHRAGFASVRRWTDAAGDFAVFHAA